MCRTARFHPLVESVAYIFDSSVVGVSNVMPSGSVKVKKIAVGIRINAACAIIVRQMERELQRKRRIGGYIGIGAA